MTNSRSDSFLELNPNNEPTNRSDDLMNISMQINSQNDNSIEDSTSRNMLKFIDPQYPERLYARILKSRNIQQVVKQWLQTYIIEKNKAMMDLFQLYIDLCAYQYIDIKKFLMTHEIEDLVRYMENSKNDPLNKTGKYFLKIRTKHYMLRQKKLATFFENLLSIWDNKNILFDYEMFFKCRSVLFAMSESKLRHIKHTGVFLTLKYITGLMQTAAYYHYKITKYNDLLKSDKDKLSIMKYKNKIEKQKNYYDSINNMIAFLQTIFENNWNFGDSQLFLMRIECIMEIYNWIEIFPSRFLQEKYFNYITQAMIDTNRNVRYAALEIINKIISKHHEFLKPMMLQIMFSTRDRINDVDYKVAIFAVETLILIRRFEYIPPSIYDDVCKHVCNYNFPLAQACGKYVVECMQAKQKEKTDEELLLMFITFTKKAIDNTIVDKYSYLVEAVFEFLPLLQNFQIFIAVLKNYNFNDELLNIILNILIESIHIIFKGKASLTRQKSLIRTVDKDQVQKICKDFLSFKFLMTMYSLEQLAPILNLIQKHKIEHIK